MTFSPTYKAFLFDVDKTLTNSNREVTLVTKYSLQKLVDRGFKIGACSGRQFITIKHLVAEVFSLDAIHILSGGGMIARSNGDILQGNYISQDISKKIVDLANHYDCRTLFQSAQVLYGNQKAIDRAKNYFLSDETIIVPRPVDTVEDWGKCSLITIAEITDEFVAELRNMDIQLKEMVGYSGNPYVDITSKGVNKATAIHQWCTLTGVKPEEIIGFGDSENDMEFLETVGYAVAMGNATEELKAIADEVTEDCDHDGVAVWLEKNIL